MYDLADKKLLTKTAQLLAKNGIPEPELSAKYLIQGSKPEKSKRAQNLDIESFLGNLKRRLNREPIQYILGDWDFYNVNLIMRPPILIPRPETEELVEFFIRSISNQKPLYILDVGTGSGAIGLAIANEKRFHFQLRCMGIDVDPRACELANENSARLSLTDRYICLPAVSIQDFNTLEKFDYIVSNPPYIPTKDISSLQPEVRLYESHQALDGGGNDGGEIPTLILRRSIDLLKKGGEIFMELHFSHTKEVIENWIQKIDGQRTFRILESKKDFAGIERFWRLQKIE